MKNVVLLFFVLYGTASADVVVTGSISLTQLQISPASGSLLITTPWTESGFAQALDSLGGFSAQFGAPSSAATSLANASGNASGSAMTASATANGSIAGLNASASSTGRGWFMGAFEITGTTDPVLVNFIATLDASQSLFTNQLGILASSEIIFQLALDGGAPTLFHQNLLEIGPSSTASYSFSSQISGSATLTPGTVYNLYAEADSEFRGVNSVPEPSSSMLIVIASIGCLGLQAFRRRS